jgi:hypothetical protein
LLYARKDESTGDHSKIDDILKSCCTPVAAWTGNLRYVPACNTVVDMQIRCELKSWCRSVPHGAICWSWEMTTLMQQYLFTLLIEVWSWRFVLAIPEIFRCLEETYNWRTGGGVSECRTSVDKLCLQHKCSCV